MWDWNGTLFHDIDAVIGATNAAFAELGLPPITLERYRELYCVPVPRFYERLIGRLPTDAEWAVMDDTFHRHYWSTGRACGLADGAAGTAGRVAGGGAHPVAVLARAARAADSAGHATHGIERHFVRVDGRTGPSGGGKAEQMVRHLDALRRRGHRAASVVIGDAAGRRRGGRPRGCAGRALHRRLAQPGQPGGWPVPAWRQPRARPSEAGRQRHSRSRLSRPVAGWQTSVRSCHNFVA